MFKSLSDKLTDLKNKVIGGSDSQSASVKEEIEYPNSISCDQSTSPFDVLLNICGDKQLVNIILAGDTETAYAWNHSLSNEDKTQQEIANNPAMILACIAKMWEESRKAATHSETQAAIGFAHPAIMDADLPNTFSAYLKQENSNRDAIYPITINSVTFTPASKQSDSAYFSIKFGIQGEKVELVLTSDQIKQAHKEYPFEEIRYYRKPNSNAKQNSEFSKLEENQYVYDLRLWQNHNTVKNNLTAIEENKIKKEIEDKEREVTAGLTVYQTNRGKLHNYRTKLQNLIKPLNQENPLFVKLNAEINAIDELLKSSDEAIKKKKTKKNPQQPFEGLQTELKKQEQNILNVTSVNKQCEAKIQAIPTMISLCLTEVEDELKKLDISTKSNDEQLRAINAEISVLNNKKNQLNIEAKRTQTKREIFDQIKDRLKPISLTTQPIWLRNFSEAQIRNIETESQKINSVEALTTAQAKTRTPKLKRMSWFFFGPIIRFFNKGYHEKQDIEAAYYTLSYYQSEARECLKNPNPLEDIKVAQEHVNNAISIIEKDYSKATCAIGKQADVLINLNELRADIEKLIRSFEGVDQLDLNNSEMINKFIAKEVSAVEKVLQGALKSKQEIESELEKRQIALQEKYNEISSRPTQEKTTLQNLASELRAIQQDYTEESKASLSSVTSTQEAPVNSSSFFQPQTEAAQSDSPSVAPVQQSEVFNKK